MASTDYDAPRRSTIDEHGDVDSLEALTKTRADAQSPVVDLDEDDPAEGLELPGCRSVE